MTYTEDFSQASHQGTYDLVWNLYYKKLHAPMQATGWNNGLGATNTTFSVGDGRHGSFNTGTYANFGSVVGTVVTIDTNSYPDLQFTDFNLASGWTLRGQGTNPLVIRSQSDIIIAGTIDCSGGSGGSANASNSTVAAGGTGRCGGGNGGNGGTTILAPTAGAAGGVSLVGAPAGPSGGVNGGASGAGGEAYRQIATPATDGTNPNGGGVAVHNANFPDNTFTTAVVNSPGGGGSGGGGGFVHNQASLNDSSGAGGGAGGGAILMYAVNNITITATGLVTANGGNGGSGAAGLWGGAGGGGGGGSILMWGGNTVTITAASTVVAVKGNGGTTDSSGGAGTTIGGNGSDGRTWLTSSTGSAVGPVEQPASLLIANGNIEYRTGAFTATSAALDLRNTKPSLTGVSSTTVTPGGSTITVSMDTSNDPNFTPTYQATAVFIGTEIKRYVKFQVLFNNAQATAPSSEISNIVFSYGGNTVNDFKLAASCGLVDKNKSRVLTYHWLMLFLLPMLSAAVLRFKNP